MKFIIGTRTGQDGECSDAECRRKIQVGDIHVHTDQYPRWNICMVCAKKQGFFIVDNELKCPATWKNVFGVSETKN